MSGRRRKRPPTRAEEIERLAPSPEDRAVPRCRHAEFCGGCARQGIAYRRQLELKRLFVEECWRAVGRTDIEIPTPIGSPDIFEYRNRMEFSFSAHRWLTPQEIASGHEFDRSFALGLHPPGTFQRVLDVENCDLIDDVANRILAALRRFARASGRAAYDPFSHTGFWRFLGLRRGIATGEVLVTVITRDPDEAIIADLVADLLREVPAITTIVHGVTDRVADTTEGAVYRVVKGSGTIVERIDDLLFEISADSFFQPNTKTAGIVFAEAVRQARLSPGADVLDLFCGTGTLALFFAAKGASVAGYELNASSVACARRNAERNGLSARFFELDLRTGFPRLERRPDVLVSDPPRAGMSDALIKEIVKIAPERLVSIGCNPKSQALNLAALMQTGLYRLETLVPIDQFPHTPHIEVVATLVRTHTENG